MLNHWDNLDGSVERGSFSASLPVAAARRDRVAVFIELAHVAPLDLIKYFLDLFLQTVFQHCTE